MVNKGERGPDFTSIDANLPREDKEKTLAEKLGHEPSSFELDLLAHPDDKDGKKKLAVELMFNEGVDAPLSILGRIKDRAQQERIKTLAAEFQDTLVVPSGDKKANNTKRTREKEIRKELQSIIDTALGE